MAPLKKYTVTLILTVEAKDEGHACEIGMNAAEHLLETFNDDDSLKGPLCVKAVPEAG